ncbi:hypothetical protein KCP69_25090 [Salmonella enterica subsp. enterica]|nr:hypothetical protein KCP69_25090 [Salmonella enterica subsp. enterica]
MMANLLPRLCRRHISFVRERGVTPPKRDLPSAALFWRLRKNVSAHAFSTRDYVTQYAIPYTGKCKGEFIRHATLTARRQIFAGGSQPSFLPHLN